MTCPASRTSTLTRRMSLPYQVKNTTSKNCLENSVGVMNGRFS